MSAQHYKPHEHGGPAIERSELKFDDPVQNRSIRTLVYRPQIGRPAGVVVFSHGSLCGALTYDTLLSSWARSGYAVIAPFHLDALESARADDGPPDLARLLSSRVRDLSAVLDNLVTISEQAGAQSALSPAGAVAAGHSFGALTALIKCGLRLRDGQYLYSDAAQDQRFASAISLSGVGPLPVMTDDAFAHVQVPLLVTGGSLDEGNVGAGPVFPWQWRMSAYELGPSEDKYSLALAEADHYFGGLLGRPDRGGEADHDGLALLIEASIAFLDAHVRQDPDARGWLGSADLAALSSGRAHWQTK